MGFARFIGAVGVSIGLAACSAMSVDTRPTAAAEQLYESLYPYYAEICAVSELNKKPGFGAEISSGIGGHSVIYLNGVCRADDAHYPTIKLCDRATPPARRGVGISVNAHFKNANWIATEGRDFFFHGTLAPHGRLTRVVYKQTQARAKAMGILDGVVFHPEVFDGIPAGMSRRDYMYEISVATDYAIGFGRDRYCARVPLDREQMSRIVDYLNGLNAVYKDGKKDFEWDVLRNNCSHVSHNALAAAGIWQTWPTERFILISAFDFPVPKNEFVNLMRRTNDMPIEDVDALYDDAAARQDLTRAEPLPTRPGALAEAERAVHDNDIYDTDLRLIFYDDPIFGSYQRHFRQVFAEPRYFDLRANLQHFANLYREIEQKRQARAGLGDDHARFDTLYDRYIDRASAEVDAELTSLPPSRATVAKVSP